MFQPITVPFDVNPSAIKFHLGDTQKLTIFNPLSDPVRYTVHTGFKEHFKIVSHGGCHVIEASSSADVFITFKKPIARDGESEIAFLVELSNIFTTRSEVFDKKFVIGTILPGGCCKNPKRQKKIKKEEENVKLWTTVTDVIFVSILGLVVLKIHQLLC